MNKKIFIFLVIALVIIIGLIIAYRFFSVKNVSNVACTQDVKICSDGSTVGRSGSNCDFDKCPLVLDQTSGWQTQSNSQYGFNFKYPADFFDLNQQPKILIGDCNYNTFPDKCPDINDIVANDLGSSGGDMGVIKSNLSQPNYWKNPSGEKIYVNNITYCLYQTEDAAMSHVYNYYYYATVTKNKCLVVNLNTSMTNCDVYLPLEIGNAQQQESYNNCVAKNKNLPKILNQIISTFRLSEGI